MLAYFGSEDDALFKDAFVGFAQTEDKMAFVNTEDADCAAEYGATAPGVVFFRTFEEKTVPYTGAAEKDDLISWVKPLMVPTVFEFSEDEIEAVFGQQQPTLFLFRSDADKTAPFMGVFEEAAKANKGKMLFAHSAVSDGIQARLAEFIGVTEDMLPSLWALLPGDMKKYKSEVAAADLTVATITQFVDDVKSGAIQPHLKSAEPEANDGPLTVVVGKNFQELVLDETKDVLVKYYAPWCGHCKKLAPIWDELAEEYKDVKNLVIAKFDATANEAEGVEIQGFPTLIFYPRDNKAGVPYEAGRELPDFKGWLEGYMGKMLCDTEMRDALIKEFLNPFLHTTDYTIALPLPAPFDDSTLDFRLTQTPSVSSDGSYLVTSMAGEVDGPGLAPPFPRPALPALSAAQLGGHMATASPGSARTTSPRSSAAATTLGPTARSGSKGARLV